VLLVSGANSPFARQFGDIATLPFPVSETVEVGGVGHMVHFEAPEWLAEQIELFLKKTL
jgi:pimeloyl-ACP methyl ester carboxylesterase